MKEINNRFDIQETKLSQIQSQIESLRTSIVMITKMLNQTIESKYSQKKTDTISTRELQ